MAATSEPASHTWSLDTSTGAAAGIVSFAGVDTTDPVDVDAPTAAVPPPADKEPGVEQQGSEGPLNGLIDFLKSGKPHGADLPGSEN